MKLENPLKTLDYKIMNITSIEQCDKTTVIPFQKLPKLLRKNGTPWISERYCHYPQKIIIKFPHLVNLSQINILSHSKKISRRIQFYYYFPEDLENDNTHYSYDKIPFKKLGFVNLRDNKQSNYSVRELKKIFIKIKCLYLKLELENNYVNNYNRFQQVGLSSIEFIGRYLGKYLDLLTNNENDEDDVINTNLEKILNDICPESFKNLKNFINNEINLDNPDYEEIKGRLNDLVNDAKKIYQLELLEKEALKDNDFDKAMEYKNKKEKEKYILKNKADEINKLYKTEFDNNNIYLEKNKNNKNNRKGGVNNYNNTNNNSLMNSNAFYEMDPNNSTTKKMMKSFSAPEINSDNNNNNQNENEKNENNLQNQINPLEEIDPKHLKNFSSLITTISQGGLQNLLSSKIGNKLEGIKQLNGKVDELFSASGEQLTDNIYQLVELIGLILEDKNTLFLKPISDLIEGVIRKISLDENLKNDEKLKSLINKNIVNKIKENLGEGEEFKKSGKLDKPSELFLYILSKNIQNYDNMIQSLINDDINILNSEDNLGIQNNKIYSKLNIIKKILEDYNSKVNDNITSKESFPKDMIAEFILLNMKNKDVKIRKLVDELLKIYIDLFGLEDLEEKSLFYFNEKDQFKKLSHKFPSLKPLFNKLLTNSEVNIFIPSQMKQKPPLTKNSFEIKYTNDNNININNKKNENENICELCKNKLGSKNIDEHNKECKMYTICEGCGENIKVEKLNNHKLDFCKNKKNYKQCNKCKEAISSDLYNLHVNKNVCNPIKENMSRCPFCHHDIEKEQEGFYQHLVIDGCAYQT